MTQVWGWSQSCLSGTEHEHNTSLHKLLRQFRAKTIQLGLIVKMSSAAGISPHQSGNWFPLHSILITFILFSSITIFYNAWKRPSPCANLLRHYMLNGHLV